MHRRELLRALAVLGLAGCATPLEAPTSSPTGAAPPSASPPAPTPHALPSPSPSPSASPPSSPPAPRATVREAVSRGLLGLPEPAPGGEAHTITGLMLHHTAAPTAPAEDAPGRFRGHAAAHRDSGFVDIAYHWGVGPDGTVYQLRDEAIAGETFTDYDPSGWLLVVCEGNFEESPAPEAMLDAVADVLAARAAALGVDPGTLVGHRDRAATLCPGVNLQSRLEELIAAVRGRIAAGGVELVVTDAPAALP